MCFYLRQSDTLRHRARQRAEHATFLAVRLDRRSIMVRAWGLARAAVARLGGRIGVHFAAALTQAWAETKARVAVFHERAEAWA